VFVTAFDEHAVRAFEVRAFDYLLKPFEFDRVHLALERAREIIGSRDAAGEVGQLRELLDQLRPQAADWDRLTVRDGERTVFLRAAEIDWVEAEGNYVKLHVGREAYLWRMPLHEAEAQLVDRGFARVSRSALVNLDRVHAWEPLFHGDSVIILRDGRRLNLTRTHRERFEQRVGRLN
jgi:two-component system LytT family response regulator